MTASIRGDGSAAFDGAVDTAYGASGTGTTINPSGQLFMQTSGTAIQIQNASAGNANTVVVGNDGSATLCWFNLVEIHCNAAALSSMQMVLLLPNKLMELTSLSIFNGGSNATAYIQAMAAPRFGGGVESRGGILADGRMYAANTLTENSSTVGFSVSASNNALIYTDGSATFAGKVTVQSFDLESLQELP